MKAETKFALAAALILVFIITPIWSKFDDIKRTRFSVISSIGIEATKEDKEKPYQFSSILSADCDLEGNLYVLDYKDVCIKIFNKTGKFLRKILGPGQGPDEILKPYQLKIQKARKHVFVLHQNGFQIKEFDDFGRFIRSYPLPEQMFGYFDFIDENRLLFVAGAKYGEKDHNNIKIFNLNTQKIEKEFAPTTRDDFCSFQRFVVKEDIVWTCPGDLMDLEAYNIKTGGKVKTISLPEKYVPFRIVKWGQNIQKIRVSNYGQPFLIGQDLFVFVTRQHFAKEPPDMLDRPLDRAIKVYRLDGERLVEEPNFPAFEFYVDFLASWKNNIVISSSAYDTYPQIKILETLSIGPEKSPLPLASFRHLKLLKCPQISNSSHSFFTRSMSFWKRSSPRMLARNGSSSEKRG